MVRGLSRGDVLWSCLVWAIASFVGSVELSANEKLDLEDRGPPPRSPVYPLDSLKPQSESLQERVRLYGYAPRDGCQVANLALSIEFSDYTIDRNGVRQNDGGWTAQEREIFSGFLCRMVPIIESLYGPPFERYSLTLIRDFYNTASSVFLPRTKVILINPRWNPQLLTHELIHAFRGEWTLTTAPNYWRYDPKLSGFEEGFAQAASYDAMNLYLDTYGSDLYMSGAWNRLWVSETAWSYDFFNDSSMAAEDFWSDGGGTRKVYERYEQAAAAIRQLAIRIPQFYRRFNESYYREVRSSTLYSPSKARIESLIQSLTGVSLSSWFAEQQILASKVQSGKKVWMTITPGQMREPLFQIHFLETFPSGSEWAHYVSGQGYLLHRLNGHVGSLNLVGSWNQSSVLRNQTVTMRDDPRWRGTEPVCYINCAHGVAAEQILLHQQNVPMPATSFLPIRQPTISGLYELWLSYRNPHFGSQPAYGISYDSVTSWVNEKFHQILGLSQNEWNQNRIYGGVVGLPGGQGSVVMSHSASPGVSVTAPVVRGVFQTPGHSSWFTVIRSQTGTSSLPGVITLRVTDTKGRSFVDQRVIDYGFEGGRQRFLLRFPTDPRSAPATPDP